MRLKHLVHETFSTNGLATHSEAEINDGLAALEEYETGYEEYALSSYQTFVAKKRTDPP
jgi:hypothetical protein